MRSETSVPPLQDEQGTVLMVRDLSVAYGPRQVLDRFELALAAGESVAVMGRSGAGKSTLMNCVLGLARPDSGEIHVDDVDVLAASKAALSKLRREKIGMVFQSGELLPELTPVENVMVAGLLAGKRAAEAEDAALTLLRQLGVPDGHRSVTEFSGGERQRVAVARALINRPRLVLADEPTGSLDPETRDVVVELIYQLPQMFGCALVVVTHDPLVAAPAQRQLEMRSRALSGLERT